MRFKKIVFLLFFSLLSLPLYSVDKYRNPFESLLPKEELKTEGDKKLEVVSKPLEVTVEGVLWGSDMPQTIIDGEVYKVGDRLKNLDATVFRITNNVVFITYNDKIYKLTVKKKEKEVK